MKKILLLTAIAVLTATAASAQWNLKYQGDVEVGYSIGVGEFAGDRVNIHTSHGIRFNKYLFAGLGTGFDIYTGGGGVDLILPIYADIKGYLPVADKLDLFLGVDIGGSVGLDVDLSGFLIVPQIGIAYKLNNNKALTFAFGFTAQSWSERVGGVRASVSTNAITLKLGFQF